MIELKHVTKMYRDFAAVQDLDLSIADGEIVGIIGHNGAGKSTTLKMIAGLVAPTSGTIQVLGRDMQKDGTRVKQFIGFLPEESPLYENMSARQYLMFFSELYKMPGRDARTRIDSLLDSLKLPEKDKLTGEFSKGMKRKVAIASRAEAGPAGQKVAAWAAGGGGAARVDTQDGVRVDWADCAAAGGGPAWVHVRASNTEPIMRLIAEARSGEGVSSLLDAVAGVVAT